MFRAARPRISGRTTPSGTHAFRLWHSLAVDRRRPGGRPSTSSSCLVWCVANVVGYRNELQTGDWLEFRRFCETSCLSQGLPPGQSYIVRLATHHTRFARSGGQPPSTATLGSRRQAYEMGTNRQLGFVNGAVFPRGQTCAGALRFPAAPASDEIPSQNVGVNLLGRSA